jgi:hypothetical protein
VKRNVCLLSIVILFLLVVSVDAQSNNHSQLHASLSTIDISLQAISWKAYDVDCTVGDTLSGFFQITQDGDLFPGDQTKYDNWLLGGIDFLIMNEETFDTWSRGLPVDAQYERTSIGELSWSFDVPSTGKWYIIYFNNSIYIKQIEGNITHMSSTNDILILILFSTATVLVLGGIYVFKKKK